jgi:GAF domain-containing protein
VRAVGDNSGLLVDLRITLGRNLTGWVAANRQSIRNSDAMLDLGEAARNLSPRLRSCLAVPIVHRDECIGVIAFYSSGTNAFSEDHQRLAEAVARQTAEVIASSHASTQPSSRVQSKTTEGAFGILYIRVRDERDERQKTSSLLDEAEKYLAQNIGSEDAIERPSSQELVVVVKGSQSDTAHIAAARLQGKLEALLDKRPSQERRMVYVALSHMPDTGLGAETAIRIARLRFEATETSREESSPGSIH